MLNIRHPISLSITNLLRAVRLYQRHVANPFTMALILAFFMSAIYKPAIAQEYPARPIRMIVPFPPGGATDRVARMIASKLSLSMGQQVIVDNRPGAATRIGTEIASKSTPDGYTLFICALTHVTNPSLFKSLPYDPIRDFSPITLAARTPLALLIHPTVPAASIKELIALSKTRPNGLNYASAGSGTAAHLGMELFKVVSDIKATQISYKGAGPQVTAMISGQVELGFATTSTARPHVRSGRLKALAVASPMKSKSFPDVPTFAELGYSNFEVFAWSGLMAPAKTPASIIRQLNQETNKALNMPDVQKAFEADDIEANPGTPQAMAKYIKSEISKWAAVIRKAGITAE